MSRGTVVARRYAKALLELARERNAVAETEEQLKLVVNAVYDSAEFRTLLAAPNVPVAAKIEALRGAFGQAVSPIVLNTLCLLVERRRQDQLPAVLEAYTQAAGEALGRIEAKVVSAKPLSDEEKDKLAAAFRAKLGKDVRVDVTVDPSLIGGLTVRIGDTLYDGSLKSKLARLEKALQTTG
jgi:F-type H+-transporting ATPase subunit delta